MVQSSPPSDQIPEEPESDSAPYLTLSNSPNQKTNSIQHLSNSRENSGKQSIYRANRILQGVGNLENLDEESTLNDASMPSSEVNFRQLSQRWKLLSKIEILVKHRKFVQKIKILSKIKLLSKIEILVKNRKFCQKSNLTSKMETFVKNRKFYQ